MAWTVKFYRDLESGDEPARDWLVGLTGTEEPKRLAALAAVECVLKVHGTDVCETEWGKNLGNGLYEFRVRHPAGTIRHMFPILGTPASLTQYLPAPPRFSFASFLQPMGRAYCCCCRGTTRAQIQVIAGSSGR